MIEVEKNQSNSDKMQDENSSHNGLDTLSDNLTLRAPSIDQLTTSINQSSSLNSQNHTENKKELTDSLQTTTVNYCNLCKGKQHKTADCDRSRVFFHATDKKNLDLILKNGFIPKNGRLGKAVYVSDDSIMCIKFAFKNRHRYTQPIILKLKVMINDDDIKNIDRFDLLSTIDKSKLNKKIKAIRCPYYKLEQRIFYQFALYKAQYAVVSWSNIKFPANYVSPQQKDSSNQDKNNLSQATANDKIQKDGIKVDSKLENDNDVQRAIRESKEHPESEQMKSQQNQFEKNKTTNSQMKQSEEEKKQKADIKSQYEPTSKSKKIKKTKQAQKTQKTKQNPQLVCRSSF